MLVYKKDELVRVMLLSGIIGYAYLMIESVKVIFLRRVRSIDVTFDMLLKYAVNIPGIFVYGTFSHSVDELMR